MQPARVAATSPPFPTPRYPLSAPRCARSLLHSSAPFAALCVTGAAQPKTVRRMATAKLHFIIVHTCEWAWHCRSAHRLHELATWQHGASSVAGLLELIWRGNYATLKWILTGQQRERGRERQWREEEQSREGAGGQEGARAAGAAARRVRPTLELEGSA